MWFRISSFIIKNRVILLISTVLITVLMGYFARQLAISYNFLKVVPKSDPDLQYYEKFKSIFGEDGNVIVIGIDDSTLFQYEKFSKLNTLHNDLLGIKGINDAVSLPSIQKMAKHPSEKKFVLKKHFDPFPSNQAGLDTMLKQAYDIKLYDGQLLNKDNHTTLIALYVDKLMLNSGERQRIVHSVLDIAGKFEAENNIKFYYAGLPYIRTIMVGKVQKEFKFFLILAALATCIVIYSFFRSFKAVIFAFLVIGISVIWTMGTIVLLGYKMTLLTGMLPALIVVISIPNCVYMLNKYHQEYKTHGNQILAISRIIHKVGFIAFMTNANTAVGFIVLMYTDVYLIREFGVVAGILSIATFLISIVIIPSLLVYLPPPTQKQMSHLDKKTLIWINQTLEHIVLRYRPIVYVVTIVLIVASVTGAMRIKAISYMVDDLPKSSHITGDLKFFEENFKGVMPLEIIVDFNDKNALTKLSNLKKLEKIEKYLKQQPEVSPPMSILNVVKGGTQAFYGGDASFYRLPTRMERNFILPYFRNQQDGDLLRSLVDSTGSKIRMTAKVADIGNIKMDSLVRHRIQPFVDSVFSNDEQTASVTGTTLLFLKGNEYLINDLTRCLLIAFILISLMMAFVFANTKMIIISVIPNVIPMMMTAGVMGLFDVHLKTSTALIFSISFGISIDNTIHYLSKYKQELVVLKGNVRKAVFNALKESGVSMIYTTLVLFFGFVIFTFSEFGGTIALGLLTSLTLFFSLFTNLILLPVLIITFEKDKQIVPHKKRRKKKKKDENSTLQPA